jgi:dTDP-4-amino-4,6-dideoxygalactose transaminase
MKRSELNRRGFLRQASLGAVGASVAAGSAPAQAVPSGAASGTLAVLGGKPVRTGSFPSWPVAGKSDADAVRAAAESRRWSRLSGQNANTFEKVLAQRLGARHCTVTSSGTTSLLSSLKALGVGPGDEVLVPPYTFVATINVVLWQFALPVFVDTDRQTFQMDATRIEAALTPRTACILPAHIGGNAADMDAILAVARKHSIPVVEDACQAHLGEWRGKALGTLGTCGCLSFQASKNLTAGEGGAVLSGDGDLMERVFAFHNHGHTRKGRRIVGGANLRMTEFQAALLLQQLARLEEQTRTREENAGYLTKLLQEVPGIQPAKQYPGCTRNVYHLYMFRYDPRQFAGVPRGLFLKALRAEGIPCSSGYTPLNKEAYLRTTLDSKAYQSIYPKRRLEAYWKNNQCPETDRLCEEAVWLTQNVLLGKRSDMDDIAGAVRKIHGQAGALARKK